MKYLCPTCLERFDAPLGEATCPDCGTDATSYQEDQVDVDLEALASPVVARNRHNSPACYHTHRCRYVRRAWELDRATADELAELDQCSECAGYRSGPAAVTEASDD